MHDRGICSLVVLVLCISIRCTVCTSLVPGRRGIEKRLHLYKKHKHRYTLLDSLPKAQLTVNVLVEYIMFMPSYPTSVIYYVYVETVN